MSRPPKGAVPVPVPGRAESGEQPGGPESPAESRDQRISTTGTDQHRREPGVTHVDTVCSGAAAALHCSIISDLRSSLKVSRSYLLIMLSVLALACTHTGATHGQGATLLLREEGGITF